MRRMVILGAAGLLLGSVSAACLADPGSVTILPNEGGGDVYPILTVPANIPPTALHVGAQMCATYLIKVDAKGNAGNVRIWAQFPRNANQFARAGQVAIKAWVFHPHSVNGKPVTVPNFPMVMSYEVKNEDSKQDENTNLGSHISTHYTQHVSSQQATLRWLCSQPPMHGVSVVAGSTVAAAQAADLDGPAIVPNPVALIASNSLPAGARAGKVRVRFCIDNEGRVTDTEILKSSPHGAYDDAALRALDATRFSVRKLNNAAVESCGLIVLEKFSGKRKGVVGRLGHMTFKQLTGTPPVPKLVAQKPVRIALSIPAGTPLPKVAKVELRLCIDKDGKVSQPSVVEAEPPHYFDQAALKTVTGWRFASSPRRMCDVYQSVQFPLGH